jgi:uncharacterized membrane protein HdeD (DUF308 family)
LVPKLSAWIGIFGGIVDLFVGALLMQSRLGPVATRDMMSSSSGSSIGFAVLAFGAVVLLTGLYLLVSQMMRHREGFGLLMILYGVVMLVLGASMIGQMFTMMAMQLSLLSGILMLALGLAMLFSGADMLRK